MLNYEEKHKLALELDRISCTLDGLSRQVERIAHALDRTVGPRTKIARQPADERAPLPLTPIPVGAAAAPEPLVDEFAEAIDEIDPHGVMGR